jgi:transposase
MANVLAMAKVSGILGLHQEGWSQRRIAEALGIDRKTVAAYLTAEASKRAKAPTGEAPTGSGQPIAEPLPGNEAPLPDGSLSPSSLGPTSETPTSGSDGEASADRVETVGSRSACSVWQKVIKEKLDEGLTAQRIHQDLVADHGFTGKYPSVRRFVARLRGSRPLPFRRLEVAPGQEAQVDFGTGASLVLPDGQRRKTHVFRIVLSHSRKAYSEAVTAQTTENFIRALENAFFAFGGMPSILVIDNLRAAVKRVDWFEPELNPKVRAFCEHYGVTILPTRPAMPRHKGKVERGVAYVQDNGLKGHVFDSLRAENEHLRAWEERVADKRIHGTTKKQVGQVFQEVERPALKPLPRERFPCFEEGLRRVHRDGHVEVAKAYYSTPPEYLGHEVWVRWNQQTVRIFNQRFEQIALHVRHEPGRFSTHAAHVAAEKITGVERGAEWLLKKVRVIGTETTRWAEAMLAERGIQGVRVLQGLLALTKKHSSRELETACAAAWRHQAYQLRTVRKLLEHGAQQQQVFDFLEEHPLIRSLSEYGQFVHESIQGGTCDV